MKKRSKQILTLFILGLVLILLAPFEQIIPSVRMGGIILSAWGMALLLKKEDKE